MLSIIFFKQNDAGFSSEQEGCKKENGKKDS